MAEKEKVKATKPKWVYYLLVMLIVICIPLISLVYYLRSHPFDLFNREAFFRYAATHMSAEQKKEFYALLAQNMSGSIWEAIPEPLVGRVLQMNIKKTSKQAEIVSNAAGMRSKRPYVPKEKNRFRILVLGDSMVMGTGGKEEDRWGDQIEEILHNLGVKVDGKEIEVYSVGIGSWSALHEATYLSHRISDYAPDIVLVMMVRNDMNDNAGVMGIGQATYGFTPEHRQDGSGVLVDYWPRLHFGFVAKNVLAAGMGPESTARWTKAFQAWKRLETLVDQTGGRMVLSVLRSGSPFLELSKYYYAKSNMKSPFMITEYFDERLPHDPHPNRAGHRILAVHYLHVLAKLGWIPVRQADLPPLHPELRTDIDYPADAEKSIALQKDIAHTILHEEIVFDNLSKENIRAILGGIYPGSEDNRLRTYPFGTLKSTFLLRPKPNARYVLLQIEVPPYVELYPFQVKMHVDGELAATLTLDTKDQAGRHIIKGAIPRRDGPQIALEVMLRTDAYWTTINDFTMKSYRLISVKQE